MKPSAVTLCVSAAFVVSIATFAVSATWAKEPINTDSGGLAIEGYDPVAYFTQGKPLNGSKEFTYTWMGAQWRFTSSQYLDLFKSNPEKYAPQYGGY